MAIILQPDFACSCAELRHLLLSAINQAGYDDFLMHINPTATPIDNFHTFALLIILIKVVTACSPINIYFAIRP